MPQNEHYLMLFDANVVELQPLIQQKQTFNHGVSRQLSMPQKRNAVLSER